MAGGSRLRDFDLSEFGHLTHVVLPAAKVTILLNVTDIGIETAAGGSLGSGSASLTGLHDRPLRVSSAQFRGVQFDLDLVTAVRLFRTGLRDLTHRVVSLEDAVGPFGRELTEWLQASMEDVSARRDLVHRLRRRLDGATGPGPQVTAAWHLLHASGGTITVDDLADRVGWSRRHLSNRMALELGMPPKQLARLVRFERAAAMLGHDRPRRDGSEIAAATGFADQAHLCGEVRRFAGAVPSALRCGDANASPFAPISDEVTDVQGRPQGRS